MARARRYLYSLFLYMDAPLFVVCDIATDLGGRPRAARAPTATLGLRVHLRVACGPLLLSCCALALPPALCDSPTNHTSRATKGQTRSKVSHSTCEGMEPQSTGTSAQGAQFAKYFFACTTSNESQRS